MKNLFYFAATLLLSCISMSCKDKKEDEISMGIVVSANIDLTIKNQAGEDLLDPATQNSFRNIKLYSVENGEKKLFFEKNLNSPNGYMLFKEQSSTYTLRVFTSTPEKNGSKETINYLQLSEGVTDTIKCLYQSNTINTICEKVWYNGKLMWQESDGIRAFEIVKP